MPLLTQTNVTYKNSSNNDTGTSVENTFAPGYLFSVGESIAHVAVIVPLWLCVVVAGALIIYCVYKYKQFHSSGYLLVASLLAGEMVYITCYAIGVSWSLALRVVSTELQQLPSPMPEILGTTLEGLYMVNLGLMTLISVQRLCCVLVPHHFLTIFTMRNTLVAVVVLFIIYIGIEAAFFVRGSHWYWDSWWMSYDNTRGPGYKDYYVFMLIYLYGCAGLNLINYLIIYAKLMIRRIQKRVASRRIVPATTSQQIESTARPANGGDGDVGMAIVIAHPGLASSTHMQSQGTTMSSTTDELGSKSQIYNRELKLTSQFFTISMLYILGMAMLNVLPGQMDTLKGIAVLFNVVFIGNNCIDVAVYLLLNHVLREHVRKTLKLVLKI